MFIFSEAFFLDLMVKKDKIKNVLNEIQKFSEIERIRKETYKFVPKFIVNI